MVHMVHSGPYSGPHINRRKSVIFMAGPHGPQRSEKKSPKFLFFFSSNHYLYGPPGPKEIVVDKANRIIALCGPYSGPYGP